MRKLTHIPTLITFCASAIEHATEEELPGNEGEEPSKVLTHRFDEKTKATLTHSVKGAQEELDAIAKALAGVDTPVWDRCFAAVLTGLYGAFEGDLSEEDVRDIAGVAALAATEAIMVRRETLSKED